MTMQQLFFNCKSRAYELEAQHPDLAHLKALDMAAREMGFDNFTLLRAAYLRDPNREMSPGPRRMTEDDVRAVLDKAWHLTPYGLGATRQEIDRYGTYGAAVRAGHESLVGLLEQCNSALRLVQYLSPRKTINTRAGSSYGLKHDTEQFLRGLSKPPADTYICNGAFICAAIHAGLPWKPLDNRGNPNAYFGISSRSPWFEWRHLHLEAEGYFSSRAARTRYLTLSKEMGLKTHPRA